MIIAFDMFGKFMLIKSLKIQKNRVCNIPTKK